MKVENYMDYRLEKGRGSAFVIAKHAKKGHLFLMELLRTTAALPPPGWGTVGAAAAEPTKAWRPAPDATLCRAARSSMPP